MEGYFTEKTFEDFGDVEALMSLYGTVHRDVENPVRSIPELVGGRDCGQSVEDEKASKPGNAIGHRQDLKHRSATPRSIELAKLGPPEVATRGGFCENDAMYQAPDLSPNLFLSCTILNVP